MAKLITPTRRGPIIRVGIVLFVAVVFLKLTDYTTRGIVKIYDDAKAAPIVLRVNEKAKVVITKNRVRHATRNSAGKVAVRDTYVPPEGRVEVVDPVGNGEIAIKVKSKGFTFSPGIGVGVVGTEFGGFTFVKFAYYKRLGAVGGVGLSTNRLVPYFGMTYHVKSNTFLHVGLGSAVNVVAGVAFNF